MCILEIASLLVTLHRAVIVLLYDLCLYNTQEYVGESSSYPQFLVPRARCSQASSNLAIERHVSVTKVDTHKDSCGTKPKPAKARNIMNLSC